MNNVPAIKDYQLIKNIGKGCFGEVFLTKKTNSPKLFATKKISLKQMKDPIIKKYLNFEIEIMKELRNHPYIINLVDLIQSHNNFYIIMEYCNGGSLSDCLEKNGKPFSIEIIQYFMRQIVEGLKYVHSKKIIHRDIKLENILVNFKNEEDKNNFNLLKSEVKIIDFGLSKILGLEELTGTALGSPFNMAPIILKKYNKKGGIEKLSKYNEKVDIWSLGTICYEMFTGQKLFDVENIDELIEKMEQGNYSIPINNDLYEEFISFLNEMLQYQEDKRSSAEKLSRHSFLNKDVKDFTKVDLNKVSDKIIGSYLIINAKNNTTIKELFNGKDENEKWVKYFNGLLNEYTAARDYFYQNQLTKRGSTTNILCLNIETIKKQFESGNYDYIKYLPQPITPEFIYGYSEQERKKKYKEIFNKLLIDKNNLKNKINSYNKINIQNNKILKKNYKKDISDYQILKNNIIKLQKDYENKWIPAPIFVNYSENNNQFIPLKIKIKRVDNNKENLYLLISFKNKEIIKFTKNVKLLQENSFNDEFAISFNIKEWNDIENYSIQIEGDKNLSNNISPRLFLVNFGQIKSGVGITFNCILSDIRKETLNFVISPGKIEETKCDQNGINKVIKMKFFDAFTGKSPDTEKITELLSKSKSP